MGSLRHQLNEVRKLRRQLSGGVVKIPLEDGTNFQCQADEIGVVMFTHFAATLRALHDRAPRPEPPDILQAIANARDREKAFRDTFPNGPPFMALDEDALMRGELVNRPLATHELADGQAG